MDLRLRVETTNLNMALRDMQRRLAGRVAPARIIEFETGKILEAALKRTSKATKASIQATASKQQFRTYDLGNGPKKYYLQNRYSPDTWAKIETKLAASLTRKLAEIGLSKRLILAAADKLGLVINAPGFVRSAHPHHPGDATVSKQATETTFTISINLNSPLVARFSSIRKALFSAIVGRRKNIEESARRGVFKELSAVAKQFPGLIVSS